MHLQKLDGEVCHVLHGILSAQSWHTERALTRRSHCSCRHGCSLVRASNHLSRAVRMSNACWVDICTQEAQRIQRRIFTPRLGTLTRWHGKAAGLRSTKSEALVAVTA